MNRKTRSAGFPLVTSRASLEIVMTPGPKKAVVLLLTLLCGRVSDSFAAESAYCPADLMRMSWAELECVYGKAEPGRIPNGFAQGRVIYCPDAILGGAKSK